ARCPAAKIPADCTPMLLLVPSATKRSNSCAALDDAAAGPSGSEHAATTHTSPERIKRANNICCTSSRLPTFTQRANRELPRRATTLKLGRDARDAVADVC